VIISTCGTRNHSLMPTCVNVDSLTGDVTDPLLPAIRFQLQYPYYNRTQVSQPKKKRYRSQKK
jgi:tRNA A37 threonylcarbamoyladenosine dehydratase